MIDLEAALTLFIFMFGGNMLLFGISWLEDR
jgi:hypothetical protein